MMFYNIIHNINYNYFYSISFYSYNLLLGIRLFKSPVCLSYLSKNYDYFFVRNILFFLSTNVHILTKSVKLTNI